MMVELVILKYLKEHLGVPVYLEEKGVMNGEFVLFEKTSSSKINQISSATFAFQSYAESMYGAARLNEKVKETVERMIELDFFASIKLNSDYNFTETESKRYRYQAVYDVIF